MKIRPLAYDVLVTVVLAHIPRLLFALVNVVQQIIFHRVFVTVALKIVNLVSLIIHA